MTLQGLEELVAPVGQALVAVAGLLVVGARVVLQPVDEQVSVLLQHEELQVEKRIVLAFELQTSITYMHKKIRLS